MTDNVAIPAAERPPKGLQPEAQAVLDYVQAVGLKLVGAIDADLDARAAEKAESKEGEGPRPSLTDLGLAFSRASRALRLTVMLRAHLAGDLPWPQARSSRAGAAPDTAAEDIPQHNPVCESRKLRVLRTIADSACSERNDYDEIERLVREGAERLEDEDLQDLVMSLPLGELVRLIARDVGLAADWPGLDARLWGKFELIPPDTEPPDPVHDGAGRQTCLDRPDPVLATKKGPGPNPRILIRTIAPPPARAGLETVRPP